MSFRRGLLALLVVVISSCLLHAQSPECADQSTTASPDPQETKITIVGVEFRGENPLSEELRAQLVDKIQQSKFMAAPGDSDKDWVKELEAVTIRESLQDEGYFRAYTEITPYLVRAESRERFYAISIAIESGPRYRLSELHVVNSTVFSPNELRRQIQLSPGEVFDVSKIRKGIEAISRMYSTKGYIYATVEPETNIDESKGLIGVLLKLDEDKQYRVGSVEILGLSTNAEKALRSLLEPGQVFDSRLWDDFLKKSKSLLPIDASVDNFFTIRPDSEDGTMEIVLDFRPCSKE